MSRYTRSEAHLERALETIPLASQTFSKSPTHLPVGASPLFVARGEGAHVWDVDGHRYLDMVSGLASLLLGYRDPDVDAALRAQLDVGITFSLAHPLEAEVAERLVDWIPCAEQVRFAKNGSDVTSGAIRIARAVTGRERVAACGYHGWHDWYIGSTPRDLGVPDATRALTASFGYNDAASLAALLETHPGGYAAVILEPMSAVWPEPGFLEEVARLTRAAGALLVFDEMVTGLRFARGGAQEAFGVTPDLATFGKGLANGMPLAALVGRRELMQAMGEVFVSGTFGGETLSLAAGRAVLDKVDREQVPKRLAERGRVLLEALEGLAAPRAWLGVGGHPSWSFLHFHPVGPYSEWEVKTLFQQESAAAGVLCLGTHNLSWAHTPDLLETLVDTYRTVCDQVDRAIASETLLEALRGPVLEPLFRLRPGDRP